ncbi:MAG: PolC-type DNA polymerase III, partial [Oscillospiraceae bacterium]|nr:PolC-type DNA polymerase III [Oscillospiraceae bacterium]
KINSVIMGRKVKTAATPMDAVKLDLGKVAVSGEVCDVSSKEIEKRGAWVLSFDLTDYTGTIHVSKFMKEENAAKVVKKIEKGMYLYVSGNLSVSRYDGDLALEPVNIIKIEKESRQDTAEQKRVELHLHTKMSAMDAVTDAGEAIRRAAEWGHPAIAITDHGVVHSFPEAAAAASKLRGKIKVIYGVEGYFINDVDYTTAVFGGGTPADEFVVFDIETTGLSPLTNAIIEIGAIMIENGKEIARFHTFADPGVPIPYEITKLTGRRDSDVAGAPSQSDAVKAFLDFAGERMLVAHNAIFDVGFINEACLKHEIPFAPRYADTLALARGLLPGLKSYSLDAVAAYFGYPEFAHHQAIDDAEATAHLYNHLTELLKKEGIADIGLANDFLLKAYNAKSRKGRVRHRHIILLVRDKKGLNNLYKLVTKSHLEDFDRYPVIRKSVLMQHREGLIIGSACEAGEVFEAVAERRGTLELTRLAEFYDYLEIQPVCNNMFMLNGEKPRAKNEEEIREFNRRVAEIGRTLVKPVVATGDVHFLDPKDEIFRHILLTAKGFDNADDDLPVYLKTTDEMLEEFAYLGARTAYDVVVKNSRAIADMCESISPLPPPKKLFLPRLEGSAEDLKELVYGKLNKLYGDEPPEIVAKRVQTELHDILERGYDIIYMTAQKLVTDAKENKSIVGSRGSVGSSVVAFLAGITEVNALPAHYRCPNCRHSDFESGAAWGCGADMPDMNCPKCGTKYYKDGFNIPFETFLGFDGDKVPDIDLNFSGEYQTRAHKYATDLFGADCVYRAGTISTVAEKTAYGYVMKYLESIKKTVTKAEENRLAQGCTGVKRTTGQHPGGLIVIPQGMEITDFCPAQHPADSEDKGVVTTHFDYHCMEDNLIKLDALGHDNPTMIKMLEEMTGINAGDIGLDDEDALSIFSSASRLGISGGDSIIGATGTIGIPEFGTELTQKMLCDTLPKNFDTLVRLSGYAHGRGVWIGNARELILSGKVAVSETIGCRDDIMLFLISKGMDDRYAFEISENVRKGRGLPKGAEEKMTQCGVPGWYVESCKKMTYLFPKAHAVAYVMEAVRIAWFKVHRPLEYYSAYFYRRSQKGGFDAGSMARGIERARAKIKEIRN